MELSNSENNKSSDIMTNFEKYTLDQITMDSALVEGNLLLCKKLYEDDLHPLTKDHLESSIKFGGHLHICKYLCEEINIVPDIDTFIIAAGANRLDICIYFHEKFNIIPNMKIINTAAYYNCMDVCKWIYDNFKIIPSVKFTYIGTPVKFE